MTIDEQIAELNDTVKCRLAPSSIHGVGVIAIRDIKRGETMGCLGRNNEKWYNVPYERLSELSPAIQGLILDRWPLVSEGSYFQSPNDDARMISFMNHSEDPNYFDDKAIRDIKVGEEITENYTTFGVNML